MMIDQYSVCVCPFYFVLSPVPDTVESGKCSETFPVVTVECDQLIVRSVGESLEVFEEVDQYSM
jgi:hypothetical protein